MLLVLAVQLIAGRTSPALPQKARERVLSHQKLSWTLSKATLPLRVVEFIVRPRLGGLARSAGVRRLVGVVVLLMACSMSLPIPLTNTAPSFVIFVLAAGIIEEDGLLLVAGMLLAPVAAAIAGLALYTAITMGPEAVEETVKPMVKGWLGLT